MNKIAIYSRCFNEYFGEREGLKAIKNCGFNFVDLDLSPYIDNENGVLLKDEKSFTEYFFDLKNFIDGLGLNVLIITAPKFNHKSAFEKQTDFICSRVFESAEILGAEYVIFKPIKFGDPENDFEEIYRENVEFLGKFYHKTKNKKLKVAIVNDCEYNEIKKSGAPSTFSSAGKLIKIINEFGDSVCACLDTGTAFYAGEDLSKTVELLGGKLKVLRLNDNNLKSDKKLPVTCGHIGWNDLLTALKNIGFSGVIDFNADLFVSGKKAFLPLAELMLKVGESYIETINKE